MKKLTIEMTKEQALLLCSSVGSFLQTKNQEKFVRKEETGEILSFAPAADPVGNRRLKSLQRLLVKALKAA